MIRAESSIVTFLFQVFAASTLLLLICGCIKKTTNINSTNTTPPKPVTSSVPPFRTREPDRYSATRVTTKSRTEQSTNSSTTETNTVWIARDGLKRREEYELNPREHVVYLLNADGNFVLLPFEKIFGSVPTQRSDHKADNSNADAENIPTDLLDQNAGESTYESLGEETIGNRRTMKFRVTPVGSIHAGHTSETLIWVDQELGMPIHSETRITDGGTSSSVTMDLRDLSYSVDEKVFEVPNDYQKISGDKIMARVRQIPPG